MSWPKIIAYYVIAALLGSYVYAEMGGRGSDEPAVAESLEPLLEGPASRIERLDLTGRNLRLSLARVEGRWRLQAPEGLSVTSDLIEALLETLSEIPPIEIVAAADEELGRFGLAPPEWVIATKGSEGSSIIELGLRSPTSTALYAKTETSRDVYLVGLNALYYVDLISQELEGQIAAAGLTP